MKQSQVVKAVRVKVNGKAVVRYAVIVAGKVLLFASSTCAEVRAEVA